MYFNNNNGSNPYPPYQNVYQNPGYFQPQSPQQNYVPRGPSLQVKIINNQDEIMPGDVPMDGSMAYFILNDGSAIFGKSWDRSGKLQTVKFPREEIGLVQTQPNDISDRLDRIENELNNLSQSIRRNNYKKGRVNNGYQRKGSADSTSTD